jgi:predicted XRE-type DNA-binding protein
MERQIFDGVLDVIESDLLRASLKARRSVLIAIQQAMDAWALPQAATVKRLGLMQTRLKDLRRGSIHAFSLAAVAGPSTALRWSVRRRS